MNANQKKLLKFAINNSLSVRIKYFPQSNGKVELTGWRYIKPLDIFRANGKEYLFGIYLRGSSLTKSIGYRLFITDFIKEVEVQQQFIRINIDITDKSSILRKTLVVQE